MNLFQPSLNRWKDCRIGITGANGSLGRALTQKLRNKGAFVIGLTHSSIKSIASSSDGPQEWVNWSCGKEEYLDETLTKIDILILNHGINPKGKQNPEDINKALEVNALSCWRIMQRFEKISLSNQNLNHPREIWINCKKRIDMSYFLIFLI